MRNYEWIILVLIFGLSGCDPVKTTPSTYCTDYHPVTIDPSQDRLSDETAKEILVNNRLWKKLCSGK